MASLALVEYKQGQLAAATLRAQEVIELAKESQARTHSAQVHRQIAVEVINQIADPIEDSELRQKFLSADPIQAVLA